MRNCKKVGPHVRGFIQRKRYEVEWEPHIRTVEGLRKPDLVATMDHLALIIEAHIFGDIVDMIAPKSGNIRITLIPM